MSPAPNRNDRRDTHTLAYITSYGPVTQNEVRAYLRKHRSFGDSTSADSMGQLTRSSVKRLENRGLVEVVGRGGVHGRANLYAVKGAT